MSTELDDNLRGTEALLISNPSAAYNRRLWPVGYLRYSRFQICAMPRRSRVSSLRTADL